MIYLSSFSHIFYVDASNEQTLEMDLEAISPGGVKQSVDESLRWLANQHEGRWLLLFDNADDIQLKLDKFFPPCSFGNILVTTRSRGLRHYTINKGVDQNVTNMDHDEATSLLLHLSQVEETEENKQLAAQIVQVFSVISSSKIVVELERNAGTTSSRFSNLPSWRLYLLPFVITPLSKTLPT